MMLYAQVGLLKYWYLYWYRDISRSIACYCTKGKITLSHKPRLHRDICPKKKNYLPKVVSINFAKILFHLICRRSGYEIVVRF